MIRRGEKVIFSLWFKSLPTEIFIKVTKILFVSYIVDRNIQFILSEITQFSNCVQNVEALPFELLIKHTQDD